jgi:DNA modification methylase
MRFEKRKLKDLKHALYNPRKKLKEGDPEYEKIKSSIEAFGYVDPIIINHDNTIVGGHQRATVLQALGYEEVEVVVTELDKQSEKALNIALNKITGQWDMPALKDMLLDLEASNFDVELTGFDMNEIEDLMTQYHDGENPVDILEDDFDVDEALENIKVPITRPGDKWLIGRHTLMCGDSTSKKDVLHLMDGEKAQIVFTDPPWNVNYGAVKEGNEMGYKPRTIMNDFMGTDDFKKFMFTAFENMFLASEEGCMTYVVMSAQEWGNMMLTLAQNNYHWSSTIIWNKDRLVLSRKDYHTKYEPIWYGWKEGKARLVPLEDRKQSDVWDIERPSRSDEHPTMKPIELVAKALLNSSFNNNIVLDLFGGSGTTLLAAEQTKRICFMMELDPKYCDVIINRFLRFTGEEEEVFLVRNNEKIPYYELEK